MQDRYDVIVIGGGHAGAEAAWAACNRLRPDGDTPGRVALITLDPTKIGVMSCNPAIGGLAKGQMVREIDALGGLMGLAADATGIQFKLLNRSKGPAVRGPRCQSDKYAYRDEVQRLLATRPNLTVLAGACERLLTQDGRCVGITFKPAPIDGPANPSDGCCGEFGAIDTADKPLTLLAPAVVLTTGTFMRGLMHTGHTQTPGGRTGEAPANALSQELTRLGFTLGRLKTGTPPRLDATTLDFTAFNPEPGDESPIPFSFLADTQTFPPLPQVDCHSTRTSPAIHDLIRANLDRAPIYNGNIASDGPRYCPSIEDKVVRFADKTSHHVFLEPESLRTPEIYCNGISTSLPADVQEQIVHALPGCEHAPILRPGYAVEYDMVWPHQIDATTMTKAVPGLFLAGQINGTSGYEEAGAQGLLAGLNAVRYTQDQDLVRLTRDQAYAGVMMDDLVTKTPREPYRMFTSRAEYRLLLRADNADTRLTPLAREWGLIDDDRWAVYERDRAADAALHAALRDGRVEGIPMHKWVLRSEVTDEHVVQRTGVPQSVVERVLTGLRYAGHIARHDRELAALREAEANTLPADLDYATIPGLRNEAAETLARFRPATLGQAGRLAGVNPADVMLLAVAAKRHAPSPA